MQHKIFKSLARLNFTRTVSLNTDSCAVIPQRVFSKKFHLSPGIRFVSKLCLLDSCVIREILVRLLSFRDVALFVGINFLSEHLKVSKLNSLPKL